MRSPVAGRMSSPIRLGRAGAGAAACRLRRRAARHLRPQRRHTAPTHALGARVRVAEPLAALDLDSNRILVRTGPQQMATLAGAKWPDRLPLVVQARLTQSFQNAGLARQVGRNPAATANYELDLDIRRFELDVARSRVEVDVAAKLVSASGGVSSAVEIFKADAPVASTRPAAVAAAMDRALTSVMKRIVAFVATRL